MKAKTMFCSACDRDVRVVLTAEPTAEGQAPLPDTEFICLEIGDRCTGALCPVFSLPPAAMKVKLARGGYDTSNLRHVSLHCDGCDRVTDLVVLSREYCYCTECGATNRYEVSHPGTAVAS